MAGRRMPVPFIPDSPAVYRLSLYSSQKELPPMTTIGRTDPLASMLGNAFDKLDQDQDKNLDRSEFKALYEMLKPGIAEDRNGVKQFSAEAEFDRMDHNADGRVSKDEMSTTGVLMPADLTDDSLNAMIKYLNALNTVQAKSAASLLSGSDPLV
jgi:hypothetical protein